MIRNSEEGDPGKRRTRRPRARLAARQAVCWLRLDDAASELWSLHSVPEEEIVARVRKIIERERSAPDLDFEIS
jgi:hypothetical protein